MSAALLHREIFNSVRETEPRIEHWRVEYNTIRPHSALGHRLPTPEAMMGGHFSRLDELYPWSKTGGI